MFHIYVLCIYEAQLLHYQLLIGSMCTSVLFVANTFKGEGTAPTLIHTGFWQKEFNLVWNHVFNPQCEWRPSGIPELGNPQVLLPARQLRDHRRLLSRHPLCSQSNLWQGADQKAGDEHQVKEAHVTTEHSSVSLSAIGNPVLMMGPTILLVWLDWTTSWPTTISTLSFRFKTWTSSPGFGSKPSMWPPINSGHVSCWRTEELLPEWGQLQGHQETTWRY